jgi:hypothetical protein
MPSDQLRTLTRADPGNWSRVDLARLVGALGWRLDEEGFGDHGLAVVTGGAASALVTVSRPFEQRYGYGEFTSLQVGLDAPAERLAAVHRATIGAVAWHLGPPPLVGGPGAWALWRLPATLVRVERRRGRVWISLLPREATETREYNDARWDEDWSPDACWSAEPDIGAPQAASIEGRMTFGRLPTRSWDMFEDCLRNIFASLAVDLPVLDPYLPAITWTIRPARVSAHYVQGWFAIDGCHVETGAAELPGLTLPSGNARDGLEIADLVLSAILDWDLAEPVELRYAAWTDLPRPGAPRSRLTTFDLPLAEESDPNPQFR